MKICHVITRLIIGGAQENTILTCRGLARRGHDVTLLAGPETGPEGSLWAQAREAGCASEIVEDMRRAVHPILDRRARHALMRRFLSIKPDVVHTHSSKAGILGRSAAAAAGVPVIMHTIHGMSFNRTQSLPVRLLYRALERRAARYTNHFVAVAEAMVDQAVEGGIAPRNRFTVVRSGMETDRFAPDAESRRRHRYAWGVADDEVVVGTVARLFHHKGYEAVIDAMKLALMSAPKLRFVWIGDGPSRAQYEDRLAKVGLRDRVRMLGLVPPDEIASHFNGFDIVLHASRWEGLPRALVQGMLTSVPAISFDNDGAPEVVIPGETGLLLPSGDIEGLSEALVELANDAAGRKAMGERGRALCLDLFDVDNMVDRLEASYLREVAAIGNSPC